MTEKDLEIQRLKAENAKLAEENAKLEAKRTELESVSAKLESQKSNLEKTKIKLESNIEELQSKILNLQSEMEWMRKKLFGKMSEKHLPLDPSVLEPTLFDEVLPEEEQAKLDAEVKKMEEETARVIEVKAHKREVRKPVYSNLPVKETHIYPEGMRDNPDYVEIGVENSDRLAIQPAVMYIERIVRHKFVLKSSLQIEDPDRQTFVIAPLPETIIPRGMASESLLADIMINKYLYHLPFYRQIQKYKELGVALSDATINDWFVAVCSKIKPLYDKLREEILSRDYIQVDESTLPVIDNEKHSAVKGYIWAVRDAVHGDVYFYYDNGSRGAETAKKLIGGYRGAIQTDGYEVYGAYEGAPGKMMIGCWAHARRKFVEALNEDKRHASEAIVQISKLYAIESEMKEAELDADAIKERRHKESYPIMQAFERWLEATYAHVPRKSKIQGAITYTYTLMPRLARYILDGRYHIDNNGIENSIRPLAIGRKNYLFCGNAEAATRAAIMYSLFSSCKARDIDVRTWLEDVLRRLPTEKDISMLLPSKWQQVTASNSELTATSRD